MKKVISLFVVFAFIILSINTTSAYLSKSAAYWNIKDAFYSLEINEKISKQERDFMVDKFYIALYEKSKDPDDTYKIAMKMYYSLDSKVRSYFSIVSSYNDYYDDDCDNYYVSWNKKKYYNKIKDLFYRLYNNWDISSIKKNRYIKNYYNDIYKYNKDPYRVYKNALDKYNDLKDSTYSTSKKNTYYNKIKDLFDRAYNKNYINSSTKREYINYYYKDIYKYNKDPYKIYKEAKEKYNYFEDRAEEIWDEDRYYQKIKKLFYELYNDDIIKSKERRDYINDYYEDIYDYNKNPYTIYKKALKKYNNLKNDDYDYRYDNDYRYNYDENYLDYDDSFIDNHIFNFWNQIDYTGKYLKHLKIY